MNAEDEFYEISISEKNKTVGTVVIFSFEEFKELSGISDRLGASVDRAGLEFYFSGLNFEVIVHVNLTSDDVKSEIEKMISNESWSNVFLCIVLSHGGGGTSFYSSDGKALCLLKDVVHPLQKSECMENIPKVYLANFCRTENLQDLWVNDTIENMHDFVNGSSEQNDSDNQFDANQFEVNLRDPTAVSLNQETNWRFNDAHGGVGETAANQAAGAVALKPRTLIAYSTLPHCDSFRGVERGSLFISTFLRIAVQKDHIWDLEIIIRKTSDFMRSDAAEQFAHFNSYGFTKKVMLFPTMNIDIRELFVIAVDEAYRLSENTTNRGSRVNMNYFVQKLVMSGVCTLNDLANKSNSISATDLEKIDVASRLREVELKLIHDVLTGDHVVRCYTGVFFALRIIPHIAKSLHTDQDNGDMKNRLKNAILQVILFIRLIHDAESLTTVQLQDLHNGLKHIVRTVPMVCELANHELYEETFARLRPLFGDIFYKPLTFIHNVIRNTATTFTSAVQPSVPQLVTNQLTMSALHEYRACFDLGVNIVNKSPGVTVNLEETERKIQCNCHVLNVDRQLLSTDTIDFLLTPDRACLCNFARCLKLIDMVLIWWSTNQEGKNDDPKTAVVLTNYYVIVANIILCIQNLQLYPNVLAAFIPGYNEKLLQFVALYGEKRDALWFERDQELSSLCQLGTPIRKS